MDDISNIYMFGLLYKTPPVITCGELLARLQSGMGKVDIMGSPYSAEERN